MKTFLYIVIVLGCITASYAVYKLFMEHSEWRADTQGILSLTVSVACLVIATVLQYRLPGQMRR